MITVKILCGCGQKFAFDVEPKNGRMPASVQCPVCGRDGTAAANQIIAQQMPAAKPGVSTPRPPPPTSDYAAAMSAAADSQAPKRKAKWLIPALAAVVVLICGAGGFFFWQSQRDEDVSPTATAELAGLPQTFEELDHWYKEPPTGQNAADFLTKGFAELQITEKDRKLPFLGKTKLAPNKSLSAQMKDDVSGFVSRNQGAVENFAMASKYKECRYPIDLKDGITAKLPDLTKIKEATQVAALVALSGADRKDAGATTMGITTALTLARSLEQEPLLISQLVRVACEKIAMDAMEQSFNRVALFPDTLAELQETLEAMAGHESGGESFTRAMVSERITALAIAKEPRKYIEALSDPTAIVDPKVRAAQEEALKKIKPKKERKFCEETFNQLLEMRKEGFPVRLKIEDYVSQRVKEAADQKLVVFPMIASTGKAAVREAGGLAVLRLALTAVALERFRASRGNHYPEFLTELSPAFLKEPPTDPFDGQPLRFRQNKRGYVLYSVGQDLQDGGGKEEEKGKGDLVFAVVNPPKANADKSTEADKEPSSKPVKAR